MLFARLEVKGFWAPTWTFFAVANAYGWLVKATQTGDLHAAHDLARLRGVEPVPLLGVTPPADSQTWLEKALQTIAQESADAAAELSFRALRLVRAETLQEGQRPTWKRAERAEGNGGYAAPSPTPARGARHEMASPEISNPVARRGSRELCLRSRAAITPKGKKR